MKRIIALALITITLSTDIIIVGDSRTYLIAHHVFGFPHDPINLPFIATSTPIVRDNNSYQIVAKPGARIYDFTSDQNLGIHLNNLLWLSKHGTYVFLWLGINNLGHLSPSTGIRDTFNKYFELAQNFPYAKFLIFSIPWVVEAASHALGHDATVSQVKAFNFEMRKLVSQFPLPNLKFVNLMTAHDPMITEDGINISCYLYDGLHFERDGCIYFFNKMMASIYNY